MRGFLIAAPQSGSGKTAFTQALLALLHQERYDLIAAKVGPDYIDPQFLSLAAQKPCLQLDGWAMRASSRAGLIAQAEVDYPHAVCIVEGVMGLFDGAANGQGSSADLAAEYRWPVVMVINTARQSFSVAALVQGFTRFRADVTIAAVVLNQVGSDRHARMLLQALQQHCPDIPVLATVPRHDDWIIPQRHLGLVKPDDITQHQQRQSAMAQHLRAVIDWNVLEGLMSSTSTPPALSSAMPQQDIILLPPPAQRIAVAYDAAFDFVYAVQLEQWRKAGAEVQLFSPLADEAPNTNTEFVLLPGGYPELYASTLAQAVQFTTGLRALAAAGVAIYGECGGYMVMGQSLETPSAAQVPMLGLLPLHFRFHHRRRALGYRQLELCGDHALGQHGQRFRAHEFHYADSIAPQPMAPLFSSRDALGEITGDCGVVHDNLSGSFQHVIDRA